MPVSKEHKIGFNVYGISSRLRSLRTPPQRFRPPRTPPQRLLRPQHLHSEPYGQHHRKCGLQPRLPAMALPVTVHDQVRVDRLRDNDFCVKKFNTNQLQTECNEQSRLEMQAC